MAESSAIEWTDATVNFWWGCTKVGPGCDFCYAETWNAFRGNGLWGAGAPRRKIKGAVALIRRLQRTAAVFYEENGRRRRVFCQSMSDMFDNEVDPDWRNEALSEIEAADQLSVQIVTKRVSNVRKMMPLNWLAGAWPKHVGLIITVVNQAEADRDVPRLLALKAEFGIPWVGISAEPLLGPIDFKRILLQPQKPGSARAGIHLDALNGRYAESGMPYVGEWDINGPFPAGAPQIRLDWIIVGGESGSEARPMHPDWARSIRDQCASASVAFLFKQWGEWGRAEVKPSGTPGRYASASAGPHCEFWPQLVIPVDHYPRQFSLFGGATVREKVGKKRAGRLLDGIEHNGFPETA